MIEIAGGIILAIIGLMLIGVGILIVLRFWLNIIAGIVAAVLVGLLLTWVNLPDDKIWIFFVCVVGWFCIGWGVVEEKRQLGQL